MTLALPTINKMKQLADEIGLDISNDELEIYQNFIGNDLRSIRKLDLIADYLPKVKYPRQNNYETLPSHNPYNAWATKFNVKGSGKGILKGKSIILKDSVFLAGAPAKNGTSILEDFIPQFDATVVTRILDEGGEIVGKANSEFMGLCGGSHSSDHGNVNNPRKKGFSSGGSSSGVAALVASGEVDMGIGGDQGGSIRIPASFSGICGMKPTHGLVPYTGVMSMDPFLDHCGPLTRNVFENALLLEAIAGPDGIDSRQINLKVEKYTNFQTKNLKDFRIGIVKEGFDTLGSEKEVDIAVRDSAKKLSEFGATVEEISVPMQSYVAAIYTPIVIQGIARSMFWSYGTGVGRDDQYSGTLSEKIKSLLMQPNQLPETGKLFLLEALHFEKEFGLSYYSKAMNLARKLRKSYDNVLSNYDVLIMPTLPMKATPLPSNDDPIDYRITKAFEMNGNAMTFNMTHHPAFSLPCAKINDLPVGLMMISNFFSEKTIYQVAGQFENIFKWEEVK